MRYRVTLRRDAPERVELRGYVDTDVGLQEFAGALESLGLMVIASLADIDYDPFQ